MNKSIRTKQVLRDENIHLVQRFQKQEQPEVKRKQPE
jgi:hypothetical protein